MVVNKIKRQGRLQFDDLRRIMFPCDKQRLGQSDGLDNNERVVVSVATSSLAICDTVLRRKLFESYRRENSKHEWIWYPVGSSGTTVGVDVSMDFTFRFSS